MESNLNPKESFAIIEAVINERKRRYEENGIFLMFWGALVAITGVAQFLMLRFDFYPEKSGYLWLCTMVLGFILTVICKYRQGRKMGFGLRRQYLQYYWHIRPSVLS